jgi:hypothetical protein
VISAPVAHIGGIPLEETLASIGPALLLGLGVAWTQLRTRLRRVRTRASAHTPRARDGQPRGRPGRNSKSDSELVAGAERHAAARVPRRASRWRSARQTLAQDESQVSVSAYWAPASLLLLHEGSEAAGVDVGRQSLGEGPSYPSGQELG